MFTILNLNSFVHQISPDVFLLWLQQRRFPGLLKRIGEAVNFLAAKDAPVPVAKSDRVEEITAAVQKLSLELPDRWLDLETICSSEDVKALAATGEEILSAVQSSELFEVREDRAIRVIQDA